MQLPMRVFWLLNTNINRLRAEEDMRSITVGIASQSQELAQETRESLILEIGDVTPGAEIAAPRDEAGFAELKLMAKGLK